MGCYLSKGTREANYEVGQDEIDRVLSGNDVSDSAAEQLESTLTPLFDDEFRFSRTVQGKKLVSKVTQSKAAPLEHVLAQRGENRSAPTIVSTSHEGKEYLVEHLKSIFFFSQLRREIFNEIITHSERYVCQSNDTLFVEGDEIDSIYFFESGSFFCLLDKKTSLSCRGGDILVSVEEIRNRRRSGTMSATSDGMYWKIDIDVFKKACRVFMDSLDHRFLTQVDYFLYLDEDSLLECSFYLQVIQIPTGKALSQLESIDQGGRHLYVLRKGSIVDTLTERMISSHQVFCEGDIFSDESTVGNYKCTERALVLQLREKNYSLYLDQGLMGIFEDKIKIQILQEIVKEKKVHGQKVDDIFNLFEERVFSEGTMITMPNEMVDRVVILKKGELIEVEERHGKMISCGTLKPYRVFGLAAMVKDKRLKSGVCVKNESATCIILSRTDLKNALKSVPSRRDSSFLVSAGASAAKKPKVKKTSSYKKNNKKSKYNLGDFRPTKMLGQGQFGVVLQVQHAKTNKVFALKVQYRREIEELGQVDRVKQERICIGRLEHPSIVKFITSFKDEKAVYLLMEAARGGELFYHLEASSRKRFDERTACFIGASILGALQHIHERGLIYRDLKPENILLDSKGFPKLVDFGCAKVSEDRNMTMCGTPEYVPPELIQGIGYDYRSDYWQFAVLLYEMICGFTPFEPGFCADHATKARLIYERILTGTVQFPRHVSCEARDLISKLLVRNPLDRLDGQLDESAQAIEGHPWFQYHKITPAVIAKKKITPPLTPASENSFTPNMGGINFTRIPQPNTSSTMVLDDVF